MSGPWSKWFTWPFGVGLLIGLVITMSIVGAYRGLQPSAPAPVTLSDCDGALETLVIHYTQDAASICLPVYQSFLPKLASRVTVHVVCPSASDYRHLLDAVGPVDCRMSPVLTGGPITCWSRDRWLACRRVNAPGVVLIAPETEHGAGVWPARRGDSCVADRLTDRLPSVVSVVRWPLRFDGGDFVADDCHVFVAPRVVNDNSSLKLPDAASVSALMMRQLGRPVTALAGAPNHHAGMYMMTVGDRTVLVGDPGMANDLPIDWQSVLPGGRRAGSAVQRQLDTVAEQCRAAGYRVVRIPVAVGSDGRSWLSYTNAILERRADGGKVVYLPVYQGVELLNDRSADVWRRLGYGVERVDCTASYRSFGALRCLVSVLRRG